MNENQQIDDNPNVGEVELPPDFDFDLFLKGTLTTLGGLFGQNRMNSASIGHADSAVTNAMTVGYRFERAMRSVKRAAGRKK